MSVASQMRLLKKLEKARGQGQLIKDLEKALDEIIEWVRVYKNKENLREKCFKQMEEYAHGR